MVAGCQPDSVSERLPYSDPPRVTKIKHRLRGAFYVPPSGVRVYSGSGLRPLCLTIGQSLKPLPSRRISVLSQHHSKPQMHQPPFEPLALVPC